MANIIAYPSTATVTTIKDALKLTKFKEIGMPTSFVGWLIGLLLVLKT